MLKDFLPKNCWKTPKTSTSTHAITTRDSSTTSTSGDPYGTLTIGGDSSTVAYPVPTTPYFVGGNCTTTGTSFTFPAADMADFKKLKCKLPESTLEKLMMIGLPKSKKVLRARIKEEFTKWCNTQELDVSIFPMLLAACMVMLNDGEEENSNKEEK